MWDFGSGILDELFFMQISCRQVLLVGPPCDWWWGSRERKGGLFPLPPDTVERIRGGQWLCPCPAGLVASPGRHMGI